MMITWPIVSRFSIGAVGMVACLALAACSGGESGGNGAASVATPITGTFVDSPVNGLHYTSPPSNPGGGVTANGGQYQCVQGDTVTFDLGGRVVGSGQPCGPLVTVVSVFGATSLTDLRVRNLAQLLLTLGGIPTGSNPIELPAIIPDSLPAQLDFTDPQFEQMVQTALPDRPLVSQEQVAAHLVASFKTLTVTGVTSGEVRSSPEGLVCAGGDCSYAFATGTPVTLQATGTGFTGWSGDGCSGTGTCQVLLTAMQAVRAIFPFIKAKNFSQPTSCAEDDNVTVACFVPDGVTAIDVIATHPHYDFSLDNCAANFTGCSSSETDFTFSPETRQLYDDGETVIVAVRLAQWYLQSTMVVSVPGKADFPAHYVRLIRRIDTTNQFPEVMVVYMDGNVRLKPQAPIGVLDTCFGSSVLIGPSNPTEARPRAEITKLVFDPATDRFDVTYQAGGTAQLSLREVNRTHTILHVDIGYAVSDAAPAAMLRSMYVRDGNADVDRIHSTAGTAGILNFAEFSAPSFRFVRVVRSEHNTSAPDIEIRGSK